MLTIMVLPSAKILNFYQNQVEIIAKHCVNKDKPTLKCEGHCYLKKLLKSDKSQEENNQVPEVFIFIPIAVCLRTVEIIEPKYFTNNVFFFNPIDEVSTYSDNIFIPPRLLFI